MAYRGSNYRRPSPVSASLIHEVRMVAQQFFTHRKAQNVFNGTPPLACLTCLQTRKKGKDAVTIQDGNAVCADHIQGI
jgi:hypothetical protein